MTSEGGGKLRQKRTRNTKPYERPKSVINRVTDAIRTVFNPTWISGLVPWTQADTVDDNQRDSDADVDVVNDNVPDVIAASPPTLTLPRSPGRSALNAGAGPSGYVPPSPPSAKPRLPVDSLFRHADDQHRPSTSTGGPTFPSGGRMTSTPVNSFLLNSTLMPDQHHLQQNRDVVSGGTPFTVAAALSQQLRQQQQTQQQQRNRDAYAGAPVHQNGVGSESSSSHHLRPVSAASSGSGSASSRHFAKLSSIGKLHRPESAASADGSGRKLDQTDSVHLAGDSHSECSEESVSTSGCSSMIPHPDKRDYQRDVLQLGKPALQKLADDLQSTIPAGSQGDSDWDRSHQLEDRSSIKSPSFLWSESMGPSNNSRPQPPVNNSRPRFNSSLLGTTMLPDNSILNGSRPGSSLSKNTRASYGFGSSYRSKLNSLNPYEVGALRRKPVQVKSTSSASSNADVMSTTAKRILETLEKMNTPLMDAKKIPPNKRPDPVLESPLTFMQTSYLRRPCLANRGISEISRVEMSSAGTSQGPPTRHLMTLGTSAATRTNYLRNFEASQTQVGEASPSGQINGSNSSSLTPSDPTPNRTRGDGGGKIKNARKETLHYSCKHLDEDDEELTTPQLRSIPLPIRELPVFNLVAPTTNPAAPSGLKRPFSSSPQTTPLTASTSVSQRLGDGMDVRSRLSRVQQDGSNTRTASATSSSKTFSFSSPIADTPFGTPTACKLRRQQDEPKFTFSSPIPVSDTQSPLSTPASSASSLNRPVSTTSVNFAYQPPTSINNITTTTTTPDIAASLETAKPRASLSGGATFSSPDISSTSREPKTTGSVMDVLRKKRHLGEQMMLSAPTDITSRELKTTGSVMDILGKQRSSMSGAVVIGPAAQLKSTGSVMDVLSKLTSNSAPSPPTTTATDLESTNNHGSPAVLPIISMRFSDTWGCPTCMIRNANSRTQCEACQTAKPGGAANPTPSFVAESTTTTRATRVCEKCKAPVTLTENVCTACQAVRPSVGSGNTSVVPPTETLADRFKMATGMWECDTCLVRNEPTNVKCMACESAKPGSSASGISTAAAAAPSFKFGFSGQQAAPSSTGSPATTFTFGVPSTTSITTASFSLAASSVAPAGNFFKFGVPSAQTGSDSGKPVASSDGISTAKHAATSDAKDAVADKTPPSDKLPATTSSTFAAPFGTATKAIFDQQSTPVEFKLPSAPPTLAAAPEVTVSTAGTESSKPTFAFGSGTTTASKPFVPTTGAGFTFGAGSTASVAAATVTTTSATATATTGGFGFQFGAASSDATKLSTTTASTDQTPKLAFGNSPSSSPAPPAVSTGISLGIRSSAPPSTTVPSGGFQFSFGKTDPPVSLKRDKATSDMGSEGSSSKRPAPSSTIGTLPAFGAFATPAAANAPASSAAFVFGAGGNTTAPAAPVFGALGAAAAAKSPSNTFSFGGAAAAPPSMFTSGSSVPAATSSVAAFGGGQQTGFGSGAGFAFGAQSTAGNAGGNVSSQPFGTSSVFGAAQPMAPMIGAGTAAVAPSTSTSFGVASGFGAGVSLTTQQQASGQPLGGQSFATPASFNFGAAASPFGAPAQPQNGGIFQFSGGQSGANNQAPGPGFGFGQSMLSNQQQQQQQQQQAPGAMGGYSFDPASPVNLNFAAGNVAGAQLPSFSAAPNPFDAQQTASRMGRTIKKARRRTPQTTNK